MGDERRPSSGPAKPSTEPAVTLDAGERALVAEALKKSGLVWISTPDVPRGRAFWHVWVDETAYVLAGTGEQPDPGWADDATVSVIVRSKETTHRLLAYDAHASRVDPDDEDWSPATSALAASRLNLPDAEHAPQRWASGDVVVYRIRLVGALSEGPGRYSAESHRAAPVQTAATTQGKRPWVLHKRGGRGRPLS